MPTPEQVRRATTHWGTAAALAQGLLLHAQHEKTLHAYAAANSQSKRLQPRRAVKSKRAVLVPPAVI
jgi:hypothetical protein